MSKSARNKAKRIFASLLVCFMLSGTIPMVPLTGLAPAPIVAKAASFDEIDFNDINVPDGKVCVIAIGENGLFSGNVPYIYSWDHSNKALTGSWENNPQMTQYKDGIYYYFVDDSIKGFIITYYEDGYYYSKFNEDDIFVRSTASDTKHKFYIADFTDFDSYSVKDYDYPDEPAGNDDFRKLSGNSSVGYSYTMKGLGQNEEPETLDLSDRGKGFRFHLFDNGGRYENARSSHSKLIITAPEGMVIRAVSKQYSINNDDYDNGFCHLKLASGTDLSDENKILYQDQYNYDEDEGWEYYTISNFNVRSDSNQMIISAENSERETNFDIEISFIEAVPHDVTVQSADHGSVSSNYSSVGAESTVTLSVNADDGYYLSGLTVLDEDNNTVSTSEVTWYAQNIQFTMPDSAVTVIPEFSPVSDAGLSIRVPESGKLTAYIPANVNSFKVYDHAGPDGEYNNYCNGTLVLVAPENFRMKVSGDLNTEGGCDELSIYKGTSTNGDLIATYSGDDQKVNASATSNELCMYFRSDGSVTRSGFDLTVLSYENVPHEINIDDEGNCPVISDKQTAREGETVTLTLAPEEGNIVSDIIVTDTIGRRIPVTGGLWYHESNTATFTMPEVPVTVTAVMTDKLTAASGLYVDINQVGDSLFIPEEISSFRIVAGSENNANRTVTLTAPENYVFGVSAGAEYFIENKNSYYPNYMEFYDGNEIQNDDGNGTNKFAGVNFSSLDYGAQKAPVSSGITTGNNMVIGYRRSSNSVSECNYDVVVTVADPSVSHSINVSNATGGRTTATPTRAAFGTNVSIRSSVLEDYKLKSLTVTDGHGDPVSFTGGKWYNPTASFMMPDTNVRVVPVFTNNLTADELTAEMTTDIDKFTISESDSVRTFRIKGTNALNMSSGIGFDIPEGYKLHVKGKVTFSSNDEQFYIANTAEDSNNYYSCYSTSEIDRVFDPMGSFYFVSRSFDKGTVDVDLTVTLFDPDADYSITCEENEHGTVTSDTANQKWNQTFTVTATPENGYLPKKIIMKNEKGDVIEEKDVDFNRGTAEFTMPYNPVTVSAEFTNELTAENGVSALILANGNTRYVIPEGMESFKLYDDGGKNKTYSSQGRSVATFTAPAGKAFQISGTTLLSTYNTSIVIYDGADTNAPVLATLTNDREQAKDIGYIVSSGNTITVAFVPYYNEYNNDDGGFDFTVELVDKTVVHSIVREAAEHGTITANAESASAGSSVSITALPDDGYLLEKLWFTDAGGKEITIESGTWYGTPTSTIRMPYSDITIHASFIPKSERYINMPVNVVNTITLSEDTDTFMIYDDGGKDGKPSDHLNSRLSFLAPEGYVFQLSGTLLASNNTGIEVFNNIDNSYSNRLFSINGDSSESPQPVPVTYTSDNRLTVSFWTNTVSDYERLALRVRLVKKDKFNAINVENAEHGTVTIENQQTSAKYNDRVRLSFRADEGYTLDSLTVTDVDGNNVTVYDAEWCGHEASFYMPGTSATVTPVFSAKTTAESGLTVLVPVNQTKTVEIPKGVQSFKVGFTSYGWWEYYESSLKIIAPEGYVLQFAGVDDGYYDSGDFSVSLQDNYGSISVDRNAIYEDEEEEYSERFQLSAPLTAGNQLTIDYANSNVNYFIVSVVEAAEDKTIICASAAEGGSIKADKSAAKMGDTVTFSSAAEKGYVLTDIRAVNENGATIPVDNSVWYSTEQPTLTMPYSNITATPVFTKNLTSSGLTIKAPTEGTLNARIPEGVKSFRINGGAAGSSVSLTCPEGYVMEFTGSVEDISTDNTYTINFTSAENNIIATLVDTSKQNTITVSDSENGSISVTVNDEAVTSASAGTVVKVTGTPQEGYFLDSIAVYDKNGNPLNVQGGAWYSDNVATFKMPSGASSIEATFAQGQYYIDMPSEGTKNVDLTGSVTSFKLYDDGGKDYTYLDDAEGTVVLTAPEGYVFRVSGKCTLADNNDSFTIYDGTTESDMLFDSARDSYNKTLGYQYSTGNRITLHMATSSSGTAAGLDLDVAIIDANRQFTITSVSNEFGTISVDETSKWNQQVTVTADPDEDCWIKSITVKDDQGNEIPVSGDIFSGERTFTMPLSDVTVEAVFTDNATAANGFRYVMAGGSSNITVPEGLRSFQLESNKNYGSTVTLTAPENCIFRINGSVLDCGYYSNVDLTVRDTETTLYSCESGYHDDVEYSFGPKNTAGNTLTISFSRLNDEEYEDVYGTGALTATIEVLDTVKERAVTCEETEGGVLTSRTAKAKANDTVILEATPSEGYTLSKITVTDKDGNNINVSGGNFFTNMATFTMPYNAVTATATFTRDNTYNSLYANMNGITNINLPESVKSFKLYDDGGKDGHYSRSGEFIITAPQGMKLLVEGTVSTYYEDNVVIYDYLEIPGDEEPSEEQQEVYNSEYNGSTLSILSTNNKCCLRMNVSDSGDYEDTPYGFDVTVTVIDPNKLNSVNTADTAHGTVSVDNASAKQGTTINVTAEPEEGYVLNKITVTDSLGKSIEVVNGEWFTSGDTSFTMPYDDVTVSAEFVRPEDRYYTISQSEKALNIPEGVTSFRIHKADVLPTGRQHSLYLYAPEGYRLKINGTATLDSNSRLRIEDNNRGTIYSGNGTGTLATVTSSYSSSNRLTVVLNTSGNEPTVDESLDLTVSVIDENIDQSITVSNVENGTVTADMQNAKAGQTVTVNNEPAEGYLLSNVIVTDEDGTVIPVTGGTWCSLQATFIMPPSPVTVTAVFTNQLTAEYLSLLVPISGTESITLPGQIASFMVYDDGGKDNNYSNSCNGTLDITVPDGYYLEIQSGTSKTESGYDYLTISDPLDNTEQSFTSSNDNITFTTSGNRLSINFRSDGSVTDSGFALRVAVVKRNYYVNLDLNGGYLPSGSSSSIMYNVETPDFTLPTPSKQGYTFRGWMKDGVTSDTVTITKGSFGNQTYSAVWVEDKYRKVEIPDRFEITGISNDPVDGYYETGTVFEFKPIIGYMIEGDVLVNGTPILPDANGKYTFTVGSDDVTVTATLTGAKHTITYKVDGEDYQTVTDIEYGTQIVLIDAPVREGYTFSGWQDAPETMPDNDVVIEGSFTLNQYTIVFDSNGGSAVESITADYGAAVTLPEPPTRRGYQFIGWDAEFPETMPANGLTLTAQWRVNQYTLTFMDGDTVAYTVTQDYNTPIENVPNTLSKQGYNFMGWDKAVPANMPAEDTVINALWTAQQFTVSFDMNGADPVSSILVNCGDAFPTIPVPQREGWIFLGWDTPLPTVMPANNVHLKALWQTGQYSVTFKDGDRIIATAAGDYGDPLTAPDAPTKVGYTFTGWDTEVPATIPGDDMVINATWRINSHTITFNTNGGSAVAAITADYGSAVTAPAAPTRTGYTFTGWDRAIPETMPDEDVTINAVWQINRYTITFDSNGGSAVAAITADYGSAVTAPAAPTRTGYTFKGWDNAVPATMPAANTTLKAQWEINKYTITFDSNGGSAVAAITADYGSAVTAPAAPTRTGYTFKGWDNAVPATMPAADTTLKAQWEINKYTVTLPENVSLVDTTAATVYDYGTTIKFKVNDGYKVSGKVMLGTTELTPDANGVYSFELGADNATVTAVVYNENLQNTSTVAAKTINITESIVINASAVNGLPGYKYAVYYKKASAEQWTTKQNFSTNATIKITPKYCVKYNVKVVVKDATGKEAEKTFTITVKSTLKNTSSLSADTINYGESVTINAAAELGAGGYKYEVWYKRSTSKKWYRKQKYSTNSTLTFKPSHTSSYDISVKVKDASGKIIKKRMKLTVASILENTSTVSSEIISLGNTVTVNCSATKGVGTYKYAVYYKPQSSSTWTTAQSYSQNAVVTFKPKRAVKYNVSVKAKDSDGNIVKKSFVITVDNSLQNLSTLAAETITEGEKLTVNCAAKGGQGEYEYKVFYRITGTTDWTATASYSAKTTVSFPLTAGKYDISICARDKAGKVDKKYFAVTVNSSNALVNTSTTTAETYTLGSKVTVNASSQGGEGSVVYEFHYKLSSASDWTKLRSYSSKTTASFTPSAAGAYKICVKAKDSAGTVVKRYINITVA